MARRMAALTLCALAAAAVLGAVSRWSGWLEPSLRPPEPATVPAEQGASAELLPAALPKPPEKLSPEIPTEAVVQSPDDGEEARPFFADFAWKDFIALNWPAEEDTQGEADRERKFGDVSRPTVWENWPSVGDLFPAVRPSARDWKTRPASVKDRPEREAGRGRPRVHRLEDIKQAGRPNPELSLVAQNRTFVRYEIRVNRIEHDFFREHKLFLRANLPPPADAVEFPDQSITVKAAWLELPDDPQVRGRFYHVPAKVVDWQKDGTPVLLDREVGLVGLHIVHKTPKRRNWVWATFEHVNNTASGTGGDPPPSFSDRDGGMPFGSRGTNEPPPTVEIGKPLPKNPPPVEVARRTPVHPATERVNDAYRNHPQVKDTVWRNYRLIVVQWPQDSGDDFERRFPRGNAANVTMETYHQGSGCINCHVAASNVRFVFYPSLRAAGEAEATGGAARATRDSPKSRAASPKQE